MTPPRSFPYSFVSAGGARTLSRTVGHAMRSCPMGGKVEKFDFDAGQWLTVEHYKPRALAHSREATVILAGDTYEQVAKAAAAAKTTVSAWIRGAVERALAKP
jgi:hypothetical protein